MLKVIERSDYRQLALLEGEGVPGGLIARDLHREERSR